MNDRDPAVFGRNVRAFRYLRGWGVRELAARSGVSSKTILKIERGEGCTPRTEQKIAIGFNAYLGRLWDAELLSHERQRVIHEDNARWYFSDVADAEEYHRRHTRTTPESCDDRLRGDPDEIQVQAERHRLGRAGLSRGFVRVCGGGIASGYFLHNRAEVFGRDFSPADTFNYTYLCTCETGGIRMAIREKEYELSEGDSIVFEGNDKYWIEPLVPVGPTGPPPTILFLCLRMLELPKTINARLLTSAESTGN